MREDIITLLKEKNTRSLDIYSIQKKIGIKNIIDLEKTLQSMLEDGTLHYSEKKNKYLLFENSELIKGELIIRKFGDAYIEYEGQKIDIPKDKINRANYKDVVAVRYDRNWLRGEVVRVISRDNSNYVAEVILKNNKLYAKSTKRPLIEIKEEQLSLVEGHRILVHNENDTAKVIEIIGHKDEPGIDILSILYDHGFGRTWSNNAKEQLKNIPTHLTAENIEQELLLGRTDLRDKKIITMDCDDTKDIDDGYYIEKLENGNIKLNVVIADVSKYVEENSPIDIEAQTDTTSVYPPGSVDPMLAHLLSNGICSLNPEVDRLAMSYNMEIDKDGQVIAFKPSLAIINSKKKMTYSDVNKILEEDKMVDGYEEFLKNLLLSQKLYLVIQDKMKRNNFIYFNTKEAKVILNETGKPNKVELRTQKTAENIIEYFMLITNESITKFLEENNLPCVYRIDGEPNQEGLRKIFLFASQKGFIKSNELKSKYDSKDIQELVNRVGNTRTGIVINKMLIRCMDKAKYSPKNIGHYPLGLKTYGQHTSPIRRYPDLINQRIIKYYLQYGAEATRKKYNKKYLEEICKHCSERELAAKKCEREATEMKLIEYMENYIGATFNAVISSVDKDGIYVLLDNTLEGYIKKSSLPNDKYHYYETEYSLQGQKFAFTLGDEIEVKLISAIKDTNTVKFNITNAKEKNLISTNTNSKPKTRKRSKNNRY